MNLVLQLTILLRQRPDLLIVHRKKPLDSFVGTGWDMYGVKRSAAACPRTAIWSLCAKDDGIGAGLLVGREGGCRDGSKAGGASRHAFYAKFGMGLCGRIR